MCIKNEVKKVFAIFTIFVLSLGSIITYVTYNDYEITKDQLLITQTGIKDQIDNYILSVIKDTNDSSKTILKNKTEILQSNIVNGYEGDMERLEYDIINPSPDSLLSKFIEEQLGNYYYLKNSNDNKPFIANYNNIIWTKSGKQTTELLNWNDVITFDYNKILSENSINAIKRGNTKNYDIIFWQKDRSKLKVTSMDIDNLIEELRNNNYDFDELKSFEILVPVYITEDGDIFGIRDINSIGQYNNNYKLYVVQRINVYDIFENHMVDIEKYKNDINYINTTLQFMQQSKATMMIGIFITICSILIVSAIMQNKK